jgi:hypothetical protein
MEHETHHEHPSETHAPKNRKMNNKVVVPIVVAAIVVLLGVSLTWLYTGNMTKAKEKVFTAVPLPAAIVDMQFVSASSVIERIALTKKLLDSQQMGNGDPASPQPSDTYNQLLDARKVAALANQRDLSINQAAIDEEYGNIVNQYAGGDSDAFAKELQDSYGMTPDKFKALIVKQSLIESELVRWYNEQEDLNKASFDKVHDLQNQISNGGNFDELAKANSVDESTRDFAGDTGMNKFDDLLPEFRDGLQDAKAGDVKLVVSRYGYHIVKVLEVNNDGENGAKQIHLQQIFIAQKGFTDWITKETDNVRVVKLLKFS